MAAQRTEKEETEFKVVPDQTPLSLSSPTTTATTAAPPPPRRFTSRSTESPARPPIRTSDKAAEPSAETPPPASEVRRCMGCRRKVGLTGFRCRCGDLFCPEHRYSDRHVCGYDYKAAGREAIARENPIVKAAKIIRL